MPNAGFFYARVLVLYGGGAILSPCPSLSTSNPPRLKTSDQSTRMIRQPRAHAARAGGSRASLHIPLCYISIAHYVDIGCSILSVDRPPFGAFVSLLFAFV
jgi:hypothetical protein